MISSLDRIVVFDAPSDSVALDVHTFQASTMGEDWLQREVISHFVKQVSDVMRQLERGEAAESWRHLAHTLRGTAAAIGAIEILEIAEIWEDQRLGNHPSERIRLRNQLVDALPRFELALDRISGALAGVCRASRKN